MLNQQTTDQLRALKLTGMLEAWEQQREQPQTHDLSFDERLALLVEREVLHRENRRLARLLKAAKLRVNALSKAVRQEIMGLVHERYADFGPTLDCEKLVEPHGYRLSVQTLRQWMIAEGLWKPNKRKAARIHQRRPHRPCPGELVQIDGSPHDWFEGRWAMLHLDRVHRRCRQQADRCCYLAPAETTWAYLQHSERLSGQVRSSGWPCIPTSTA